MTSEEIVLLNEKKMACFYFITLLGCLEILSKTFSPSQLDREEKWFDILVIFSFNGN